MRSAGRLCAIARSSFDFLKVTIPVKDTKRPSAIARRARSRPPVKQCSTAGKAPLPVSSSNMRAISSSASREWMTRGRPVARAAAIWLRKPCSCAARGRRGGAAARTAERLEGPLVGRDREQVEQFGGGTRNERLGEDRYLADHVGGHIEHGPLARRIRLGQRPRGLAGFFFL